MDTSLTPEYSRRRGTALGVISLLFWSSSIAFSSLTARQFGIVTVAAFIYFTAGIISCGRAWMTGDLKKMLNQPRRYMIACGILMPLYTLSYYGAVGLIPEGETVEVGLINYLWPALVLTLSVPILRFKWRWPLIPGVLLAMSGIFISRLGEDGLDPAKMLGHMQTNWAPFSMALFCAVTWALYSNLARLWGNPKAPSPMPIFMLLTGVMMCALRPFVREDFEWNNWAALAVVYSLFCPTILAYIFWDVGMRTGNFIIVGSASYLTPILSTLITSRLADKKWPGPYLWFGAAMVFAGACICKISLFEREAAADSVEVKSNAVAEAAPGGE
jgi:drug/metabolite transporter (DMT)-like permease